jgi:hypothetical protein
LRGLAEGFCVFLDDFPRTGHNANELLLPPLSL